MSMNWQDLLQQAEEGGTYEALPEGSYTVQVASAEAKNSTTGKPMIVVKFQVMVGPFTNRLVWNNFVITQDNPNALAWFFKHMAALGLDKQWFAMNPSLDATAAALVGKQANIDLAQKVWNNEVRNDVKAVKPLTQGGPMPQQQAAPAPQPAPQPAAPAPTPAPQQQAPQPAPQPEQQAPAPQPEQQPQPQQTQAPTGAPPAVPF